MQNNWWKILACILLIYTLIVGLSTPIEPGLKSVSSLIISPENTSIHVEGYNTHFLDQKESQSVTLRNDSGQWVCAEISKVISNTELLVEIDYTPKVSQAMFRLFISNSLDGTMEYSDMNFKGAEVNAFIRANSACSNFTGYSKDTFAFPYVRNLYESIRNLFFHVPMWFAMIVIMLLSAIYGILYLAKGEIKRDIQSETAISVGLLLAFLGLATGSVWAKFTWSEHTAIWSLQGWWVDDPKLNGSAIATLIYCAYYVLKRSINDKISAARIAAVYNIFAFVMFFVLIMIYPRIQGGLHPGMENNPAFSSYDLNNNLRLVFYPAIIGFILLSIWIWQIRSRIAWLKYKREYED
ncbi:MAG: cytochrome c biogenesis protein CcsA [Bacteroidota bacterium]